MSFGEMITKLRQEKGIYQKELATYLNVTIGTVSNYETDRHFPDQNTLCKIADFFDVSTDYMLGRTNYRHNLESLQRPFTDHYTISDLINMSLELSPKHKLTLEEYIQMLKHYEQTTAPSESSGK